MTNEPTTHGLPRKPENAKIENGPKEDSTLMKVLLGPISDSQQSIPSVKSSGSLGSLLGRRMSGGIGERLQKADRLVRETESLSRRASQWLEGESKKVGGEIRERGIKAREYTKQFAEISKNFAVRE